VVESLLQSVVLVDGVSPWRAVHRLDLGQDRREVEAAGLPVLDRRHGVKRRCLADGLLDGTETEGAQVLADLFGDVLEERLDELGLAREP